MKVLICTDGSEISYYAAKKVLSFFKKNDAIDILYVMDWGFFPTYVSFPTEEDFLPAQKTIAQNIIKEMEKQLNDKGFNVNEKKYFSGKPEDGILKEIAENSYDLVVLGSHGKKGIKKWLGSVSRKVISKSSIPTLIVRPSKNPQIITHREKKELLIALDGSACSYNAIKKTCEIFELSNKEINLLTVRPGPESLPLEIAMDNEWLEKCLDKQKEIANEILDKAENILSSKNIRAKDKNSLEGDAADKILEYSTRIESDLIIMGSHGREGVSDILIGSVSKRVLDHSYIPVLIIPLKQ